MKVIGIDVGFAILGWSILEKRGSEYILSGYGVIETGKNLRIEDRLKIVYEELLRIIDKYNPIESAVETIFFFKNQKTVIDVAQVRGIILLALSNRSVKITAYTPLQVKVAVTGYGRAEKHQIQQMVKLICKLKEIPKPDDAADAIALAICHFNSTKFI